MVDLSIVFWDRPTPEELPPFSTQVFGVPDALRSILFRLLVAWRGSRPSMAFPVMTWGNWKKTKPTKILVAKNRLVFGCTIFRHHLAVCRKFWQSDSPFHVKTFRLLGTSQMTQMIPLKCPWLGAISSPSLMTQKGASMCRYTWSSGSRYRR
jgi:hypothetical protein